MYCYRHINSLLRIDTTAGQRQHTTYKNFLLRRCGSCHVYASVHTLVTCVLAARWYLRSLICIGLRCFIRPPAPLELQASSLASLVKFLTSVATYGRSDGIVVCVMAY